MLVVALSTLASTTRRTLRNEWNEQTPVSQVLQAWGERLPVHFYQGTPEEIKQGRELLTTGKTVGPDGKDTPLQSLHYKCTHCHNLVREDPDPRHMDVQARLVFASMKDIPFLPGTTLYGVVNRASWYNDDYVKKYGQIAEDAHLSLRNSIHLCATTCSQGRALEEWEMNAVLAYLWSIELKLGDLRLTPDDWERIRSPLGQTDDLDGGASRAAWLKTFWAQTSPATFGHEPEDLSAGYGLKGDAQLGGEVYRLGCMHCHEPGGITFFVLDTEKLTFQHLRKNLSQHGQYNLYHVTRDGVSPLLGEKAYMPNYTEERLSNKQVEDLRAYIEAMAS
jgi:mono/diheme cytochrome c family protein